MAGVDEFNHYTYPRVRNLWECDPNDEACKQMALHQASRDSAVAYQKYLILEKRWWACRMIHKENVNMYCQEERMRFDDAFRRYRGLGKESLITNAEGLQHLDRRPYEPIRPDDYQRSIGNQGGFTKQPYPNTHKEPLEVVQMDATKRKPITDPDRPTVSVRLFDNTRREVVLDLPPKKLEVPKQVTSYDPEKFKTGTE
ncbi:uncharacterized protein LOC135811840 [Sycon ciliatum]|uniref:uncharacterized protein LOC135811840 n=1 Tax=Sycon ciliatum TaxID=27933 RepID=UPI0020A92A0B|eukprot:scpid101489/ scgid35353/ 